MRLRSSFVIVRIVPDRSERFFTVESVKQGAKFRIGVKNGPILNRERGLVLCSSTTWRRRGIWFVRGDPMRMAGEVHSTYAPGRIRMRSLRNSAQGRLFAPPEKRLRSG